MSVYQPVNEELKKIIINTQNVVQPCNRILYSITKECTTDILQHG